MSNPQYWLFTLYNLTIPFSNIKSAFNFFRSSPIHGNASETNLDFVQKKFFFKQKGSLG